VVLRSGSLDGDDVLNEDWIKCHMARSHR
jgi:hypothetical protein